VNRRILIGSSAAVLVALVTGVVLGLSLRHEAKRVKAPKPAFVVSSRYFHHTGKKINFRVFSGTMSSAPRWPVVIWTDSSPGNGHPKPWVIAGDDPTGPLRILEGGYGGLLLRAKNGYTYSLEGNPASDWGIRVGADLHPLGKRLDPKHLPALSKLGVAVPVQYGRDGKRRAVVLVGLDKDIRPHLYGYLAGYSISQPSPDLDRPLLGPDHALFRIDPSARRLDLVSRTLASRKTWNRRGSPQTRCRPWPGGAAGTYLGCPGRIDLVQRDGTRTTVYRDEGSGGVWEVVLPSPDGKTLLVQEGVYACGGAWQTSFLPANGGKLRAIPSGKFSDSWALGWLTPNSALVAARAPGECGPPYSGIYAIDRRYPDSSTLILATTSDDATIWRSK